MMKMMKKGQPQLLKDGTQHLTGLEAACIRNIQACKALADIVRTSLGPNGMNKMVINHLERIFVTSDCATIMQEMEVEHPAAKLLVMAAKMQEVEVGDGSNFVVCFGGELLAQAEDLIKTGLHPSEIVQGYSKALKKALEFLEEISVLKVEQKDLFTKEGLMKGIIGSISSKQYGNASVLAPLVVDACLTVMPKNPYNFAVDNVRVCKILGGNINQCEVIKGMVVPHDTVGQVKSVKDSKVAVFTCSIAPSDTETKGTVLINSAKELMEYSNSEEKEIEKVIKGLHDKGITCVVTGSTIDDMALHYIEKYKLLAIKLTSQHDLRRLCRAVKAKPMVQLAVPSDEYIGFCSSVAVREVGLQKITILQQESKDATQLATILLRASTSNNLNDLERAIDDGVNVIRMMGRDSRFVAGAGAADIELARRLAAYGSTTKGLEQYAVKAFSKALEVVPRTLAENSGAEAIDMISQLYAAHEKGDTSAGIDIDESKVKDMTKHNIYDLLATKKTGMSLATDAITTILRIDQIIMAKPAGGPKLGQRKGHWDEDDD